MASSLQKAEQDAGTWIQRVPCGNDEATISLSAHSFAKSFYAITRQGLSRADEGCALRLVFERCEGNFCKAENP